MAIQPDNAEDLNLARLGKRRPSVVDLFGVCFKVGVLSFGGGLSGWLFREFVERKNWVSDEDFTSSLAISQMLPGANVINLVICLGEQLRGPVGAIACISGFVVGPFFAVIALSIFIEHAPDVALVQAILNGVTYTAVGLIFIMCWRGVSRLRYLPSALLIIFATTGAVAFLGLPILAVVAVAAPISVGLAWRRQAKRNA